MAWRTSAEAPWLSHQLRRLLTLRKEGVTVPGPLSDSRKLRDGDTLGFSRLGIVVAAIAKAPSAAIALRKGTPSFEALGSFAAFAFSRGVATKGTKGTWTPVGRCACIPGTPTKRTYLLCKDGLVQVLLVKQMVMIVGGAARNGDFLALIFNFEVCVSQLPPCLLKQFLTQGWITRFLQVGVAECHDP